MAGSQSRFLARSCGFAFCSNDFPYPSAFMQATLEDLGQLKRAFRIEVSLEEIKPTYDAVYQRLRNTRLNGFRPGKFPKGWLDKRFKTMMQQEVAGTVIPRYLNQALHDHELSAATQASIEELEFDRRSPLFAKLHFEVKPDLELPDYTKLQLERRTPEEIT
ncbi:MAG: trigger factor family protein, partial [SAR324 cluster bacterium]|nr:trigger factor family protein [SAR324 cluster bacterium]